MADCCGTPNDFPVVNPESSGGKPVEIIAGPGIGVEDLSDADTFRFRVSFVPYVDLQATLTLIAKEVGVAKSNPVLKGTIIDTVELDWTYNKEVTSQMLTNTGALAAPTLGTAERSHDYTSQTITSDITFTLSGNDGNGQPGSINSDAKSIIFGNNMLLGDTTNYNLQSTASFITATAAFSKIVKTARAHTYFATGGTNEHHYVVYPKAWGLGTFKKGIFEGGYVRLKNVAGTLKQELGEGDVESDIMITNEKGHSEAYYVYMSLYDNQEDAVTPFVIS